MSCSNCGPNGLCQDCINGNAGCGNCNPCTACPENTVNCETLPSAIDNFTQQFFGKIERTVIDGKIAWILPCDLNVGLEGNPRGDDESLACYFLRLFREGIIGQLGPKGDTGAQGTNGRNAYTVITSAFDAPTAENPNSQFTVIPSPVISVGQTVFVSTLGWLVITDIFEGSTVFTTLIELIPGSAAVITPGQLVLPTGPRGLSIKGDTGDQGAKGDQGEQGVLGATGAPGATGPTGPAGAAATNSNGTVTGGTTDFTLTTINQKIDFGTNDFDLTLPTAGTYLVLFQFGGLNNSGTSRTWTFKLRNQTTSTDIPNSEQINVVPENIVTSRFQYFSVFAIVTISTDGEIIEARGETADATATQKIDFATAKSIFIKLQ